MRVQLYTDSLDVLLNVSIHTVLPCCQLRERHVVQQEVLLLEHHLKAPALLGLARQLCDLRVERGAPRHEHAPKAPTDTHSTRPCHVCRQDTP